jgi:hypothetical protein
MTYEQRMTKIIHGNGRIILKSNDGSGSYIHQHTNIAAGALGTVYTYQSKLAMVFADLSVAHSVARILGAKVVVLYPKKKSPAKELFESTGMAEAICNLINRKLDEMEDAEPKNEFDQAEDLIDRAEAARNLILRNHKVSDETKHNDSCSDCANPKYNCNEESWCSCHCHDGKPFTETKENVDALEKLVKERKSNIDKAIKALKIDLKEQEVFWESIKKSADQIRNQPSWIKAGVAIAEDGFTTLGSSLRANAVYQPIENHCNNKTHNCQKGYMCACLCSGCREFNF